jgi:molybdate transport system regulatory protein
MGAMGNARQLSLRPRLRVLSDDEIALGPGKADLLEAVRRTGRLRAAAEELGMSYMRAWKLVRMMNRHFRKPVIEYSRGGKSHGGASLTKTGEQVLALYREMERASLEASAASWKRLRALLD